jgi:hypothetical protein
MNEGALRTAVTLSALAGLFVWALGLVRTPSAREKQ